MTDKDVTINTATGGLKFRVDPQTLSSNKMYRLPDGRIFAINANPNMPGGYSATIVAVTETSTAAKNTPRGTTFLAKVNAVSSSPSTSVKTKNNRKNTTKRTSAARKASTKAARKVTTNRRPVDLKVPIEWYRYNLIDAVDALEYSLSKLQTLKKEATTMHLRTRTVDEMRTLHRTLERLLHTSSTRFQEVRDNLNRGLKEYLSNKNSVNDNVSDDDDDDVEILPNPDENDDLIYIDENSVDSNTGSNNYPSDEQEINLVSDHNDSGDKNTLTSTNQNNDSTVPTCIKESVNKENDTLATDESIKNSVQSDIDNTKELNNKDEEGSKNDDVNTVKVDSETEAEKSKDENGIDDPMDDETNIVEESNTDVKDNEKTSNAENMKIKTQEGENNTKDFNIRKDVLESLLKDDPDDVNGELQNEPHLDEIQENNTILSN